MRGESELTFHNGVTSQGRQEIKFDVGDKVEDAHEIILQNGAYIRYKGMLSSSFLLSMSYNQITTNTSEFIMICLIVIILSILNFCILKWTSVRSLKHCVRWHKDKLFLMFEIQ